MKRKREAIRQPKIGTPGMRLVILIFFAALIIVADLFLIFNHGRKFSETENRMLQQAPELTMTSLMNGKFMTQEDDFVTDQFFMRDGWISMKLFMDKISGKVESNNVYLGKQGYLIEKPVKPAEEFLMKNVNAIKGFAEKTGLDVVMTLVPGTAWVCDQLLPDNAPVEDVGAIINRVSSMLSGSVTFVDVTGTLKAHKSEDIYYKSDHHWKSLGAKYAFDALAAPLGIESPVNDYAVMSVTNSFSGTMASNSGDSGVKDSIEIYVPLTGDAFRNASGDASALALQTELEYVVEYVGETKKSATVFSSEALNEKDKYQVFMGGNHSLVNIKTNVDNGRNLLMLKDSYANTFVQFLLPYYHTITIVDPRYYSEDLSRLISDNGITEALILYYENNFVTDNSLFGVLEDMLEE